MKKILVILGPTSTGKTDLALDLAKKYSGELVSCDSRQVYMGLDIGTGKQPSDKLQVACCKKGKGFWEINGIKIWMYDVADPRTQFTVKDYVDQAEEVIEDIINRNKLPIIVGGTGLYLKALLEGLPNLQIPVDEKLRRELEKLSLKDLQGKLQLLSPAIWKKINESDRKNPRRLLRSIELILMNPYMKTSDKRKGISDKYDVFKIGLTAPREILKNRIFDRLLARFNSGLVDEARMLHDHGLSFNRMKQLGLEYGVLADFLEDKIAQEELIQKLININYQYSKRQMTWFKLEKNTLWFDINQQDYLQEVEKQIQKWYH